MEIKQELREVLNQLKEIDFKNLERSEELGRDYNFKEAVNYLTEIYSDLLELTDNIKSLRLPNDTEDQVLAISKRIDELSNEIRNFVLKGNETNASGQYNNINESVQRLYQESLRIIVPLIERIRSQKVDVSEAQKHIVKTSKDITNILEQATESKNSLDNIVSDIRNSLGKEGAVISQNDFVQQATEHEGLAKKWLYFSVVAICILIGLSIYLFNKFLNYDFHNDYGKIVQFAIYKVILLSTAYLVVYQAIKNYKINRHLYILNKHRQLTLSVYPLMVNATNNQEQSNIIVGQASKAIFDPGTTGYLDGESVQTPMNLTEVITRIADKK